MWGMDLIGGNVDIPVRDVSTMTFAEVKAALDHYDIILSAAEEETDLDILYQRGGKESPRADAAKKAREAKTLIHSPGSTYHRLIARFADLATEPVDRRAVALREIHAVYERFVSDPEFDADRKTTLDAYRKRRISVPAVGEVGLDRVGTLLQSHPDSEVRKAVYLGSRALDDIEALVHHEINRLNSRVHERSQSPDFFSVRANYCEVPADAVELTMRAFVDGTKETYEKLFRELITSEKIKPWDFAYLVTQKDPFTSFPIPTDPHRLLAIGLDLLRKVGYDSELVDRLYGSREGVYLDIEEREGKGPGAFTCSLGPFSHGKNILFYNPRNFEADARRRWTVFPHELGHGIHHEMSREASARYGAVFFGENTVGLEVISKFHDALPLEEAFSSAHFTGSDLKHIKKWQIYTDLSSAYGIIRLSIGDMTMHREGTQAARGGFHSGYELVRPELVDDTLGPSSAYVLTHHLFNQPGYIFTYFMADLYRLALLQAAREQNGALITPNTASFLTDKIMVGNVRSMHERVVRTTGTSDLVGNATRYFNDSVR